MMRLGKDEILLMNALSNVSGVSARDCLIGENIVSFVVKEKDMGGAIGKKGETVKKLQQLLKKNIEIVPYTEEPEKFPTIAFEGVKFSEIKIQENDGKKTLLLKVDSENKRKLLQNNSKMRRIKEIAKRNYEIEDIRIN